MLFEPTGYPSKFSKYGSESMKPQAVRKVTITEPATPSGHAGDTYTS